MGSSAVRETVAPVRGAARRRRSSVPAAVLELVVGATGDGDRANTRAVRRVPVAAAERLLHRHILRGARCPVNDGRRDEPNDGHGADHVGRGSVDGQRGGVRVVVASRPQAAADRLVGGHGVFGRFRRVVAGYGRPPTVPGLGVAAGRRRGVRVQRFGGRADVPVDAGRPTVARHRPARGRRGARHVRVRAHVRRAQNVPVRRRLRFPRPFRGRRVRRVRRRLDGHGRVRGRPSARDVAVRRCAKVFRRPRPADYVRRVTSFYHRRHSRPVHGDESFR